MYTTAPHTHGLSPQPPPRTHQAGNREREAHAAKMKEFELRRKIRQARGLWWGCLVLLLGLEGARGACVWAAGWEEAAREGRAGDVRDGVMWAKPFGFG